MRHSSRLPNLHRVRKELKIEILLIRLVQRRLRGDHRAAVEVPVQFNPDLWVKFMNSLFEYMLSLGLTLRQSGGILGLMSCCFSGCLLLRLSADLVGNLIHLLAKIAFVLSFSKNLLALKLFRVAR